MAKLYRLDVTEGGERSAVFVIADDVQEVIQAVHDRDSDDIDADSLEPYVDGDKRPKVVTSVAKVEADHLDFVPWGANDQEETVAEFLAGGDEADED